MARIRSIKPDLPHSESMGRVSRDARLLFILLWTLADDSGTLRGNSRMLASLLFPYDDDAPELIASWLGELFKEECIAIYEKDGSTYVYIRNWLRHQKIDKPSQSKLPQWDGNSRGFESLRENSLRSGEEGNGKDSLGDESPEPQRPKAEKFQPPTIQEVREFCHGRGNGIDPVKFVAHYQARGWELSKGRKMKDWRACVVTWERNNAEAEQEQPSQYPLLG